MNEPDPMDDPGTGDNPGTGIDGDHPGTGIEWDNPGTSVERRDPRKCTAHNRAGQPCGKFAMRGGQVCRNHGGASPQALAKAQAALERADMKIRGLAIPAVDAIERLLQAESEAVILAAAKDILDRGGLKAAHRIEVDTEITVVRPW